MRACNVHPKRFKNWLKLIDQALRARINAPQRDQWSALAPRFGRSLPFELEATQNASRQFKATRRHWTKTYQTHFKPKFWYRLLTCSPLTVATLSGQNSWWDHGRHSVGHLRSVFVEKITSKSQASKAVLPAPALRDRTPTLPTLLERYSLGGIWKTAVVLQSGFDTAFLDDASRDFTVTVCLRGQANLGSQRWSHA